MRNFRVSLLVVLLMVTVIPQLAAIPKNSSPKMHESGLESEPPKLYTEVEMESLLQIAEEEITLAVKSAYEVGYKDGYIAVAPDAEYWKSIATSNQEQWWEKPLWFLGGLAVGGLAGFIVGNLAR